MNNKDMLRIAMEQSAEDIGCKAEDFMRGENVIVPYRPGKNVRKYISQPITCNMVSYGNNIVAAVTDEVSDIVTEYIGRYEFYHCFETPDMNWLDARLAQRGQKVCFMAEYYLLDTGRMPAFSCAYETRILEPGDFGELYLPQWGNALCKERSHLDVLGIGAYDKGKLIGLAGCSADCDDMWQIGIDVLPEYRRQGIATALTSELARQIMERGKVPFYCSAWSNIRSVRNAVKSGFIPAWAEMTIKPVSIVDDMVKTEAEKKG
ncbi:MAG: GNAT family N-acetyltransferase [Oscillospiraceae bacterium]|nr:GNAT family N-acetyltransferase [Oscillospiraceae bacterium]